MSIKLFKVQFGLLKIGAKFLGKPTGGKKRLKLTKKSDTHGIPERGTIWHQFKKDDLVWVWRWSPW